MKLVFRPRFSSNKGNIINMPWRGHARIVSIYAYDVAEMMQLPEHMQQLALLAGAVHDIGKRSIPEYVLDKPGKLTKAERHIIEHHTVDGEAMLIYLAEIVRYHHERYDGAGYPDQLEQDEIPLISQIVAVCDAYNAMVGGRAYRTPIPAEEAIEEIKRCSGTQFDPKVVDAFLRMMALKNEEYKCGSSDEFSNVTDRFPAG